MSIPLFLATGALMLLFNGIVFIGGWCNVREAKTRSDRITEGFLFGVIATALVIMDCTFFIGAFYA